MSKRLSALLVLALACQPGAVAADAKPMLGPGATKDEVLAAYGWPNGQSKAGAKEILTYKQGQIVLEHGRVDRVDFSKNTPWPAPRPRPAPPTASTNPKDQAPAMPDPWLANLDAAIAEAGRRQARILALFTGSDWSPASKQFHDQVEFDPGFIAALQGEFVFLRLDFPTRTTLPPEVRDHHARARERYGVTLYPTLLVLSSSGDPLAQVDLTKDQPGASYRDRVFAAVQDVRKLLKPAPKVAAPASTTPANSAPAGQPSTGGQPPSTPPAVASSLARAQWVLIIGIGTGLLLAGVMWWLLWRRWKTPDRSVSMATRIADAAAGLPSPDEMAGWPRERVRGVVAALAEANRYAVKVQPAGAGCDLMLTRRDETVQVCCAPAHDELLSGKRVRELVGGRMGAAGAWVVAPAGFASDARAFAREAGLVLIDAESMLSQLRDLPPLVVPKVLARRA